MLGSVFMRNHDLIFFSWKLFYLSVPSQNQVFILEKPLNPVCKRAYELVCDASHLNLDRRITIYKGC